MTRVRIDKWLLAARFAMADWRRAVEPKDVRVMQDVLTHVCSTLRKLISAPRCLGSAPISKSGSSADLAVILRGHDPGQLRGLAAKTLEAIRRVPGSAESAIEQESDQAQVQVLIDRRQAARYGINIDDIQQMIELAVGGRAIVPLFEGERKFDITARYVPAARADNSDLRKIIVHTADGGRIPLSQIATVCVVDGASIIARRENQRQVTVRTSIRGRDQGGLLPMHNAILITPFACPRATAWNGVVNSKIWTEPVAG